MTRRATAAALVLLLAAAMSYRVQAQIGYDRLLNAAKEPRNWLIYSGGYFSNRYSALTQITPANAKNLELKWMYQAAVAGAWQTTPLVVDGIMYLTQRPNDVVALDAKTGRVFWIYRHQLDPTQIVCCGSNNRGLAILGDTLYMGTLDAHLVAIDTKSGRPVWNTRVADNKAGYSVTLAPLVVKDKVIIGVGGGEYGIRGFVAAYDARSGSEIWRFYTIPGPTEAGFESWNACPPDAKPYCDSEAWKHGGGSVWVTGSYDSTLNQTYWGVGNAGPDWNADQRPGDNLYTDSVVALDADTGRLKWHYQFTPHDRYDYDSVQVPVLADITWRGTPIKAMVWANRNGNFYVLDRETGRFLVGKPFVKVNWMDTFDERGRPHQTVQPPGQPTWPGNQGGTNWYSPSYSPHTGLFYVSAWENYATIFGGTPVEYQEGRRSEPAARADPGRAVDSGLAARSDQQLDRSGGDRRRARPRCGQRRHEMAISDDGRHRQRHSDDGLGRAFHRRARRVLPRARRPHGIAAVESEPWRADRQRPDHVRSRRPAVRHGHLRPLVVRVRPARIGV